MLNLLKRDSAPPTVQQIAKAFRLTGWICFWVQLVLAIISTFILLFAAVSNNSFAGNRNNPGTGVGLLFAVFGVLVLYGCIYWAFRYTRVGRRLEKLDPGVRPKKAETIQVLRIGLALNLAGMLLTVLGAEAIVGGLLAKSVEAQGAIYTDPGRVVQALDIFVVQANTNIIAALLAGIFSAFFLLNRIIR